MTTEQTPVQKFADALENCDLEAARKLLAKYPELLDEYSWLHSEAAEDNVKLLDFLVSAGIKVDALDKLGMTPLADASRKGCVNSARWLLDHGAEVEIGAGHCATPLIYAVGSGSVEMCKLLLERGADPSVSYSCWDVQTNALSKAIAEHKDDLVQLFREHGAVMPHVDPAAEPISADEEIIQHVQKTIGMPDERVLAEIVPASDKVSIAVHVVPPGNDGDDCITLFTTGMSDLPMNAPEGGKDYRYAELIICLPRDWPLDGNSLKNEDNFWPIKWLRQLAYYPHESGAWIGPEQVISNGEPPEGFSPGIELSCMLTVSDPDLEPLLTRDGKQIRFYQLIPIYKEERDLQQAKGTKRLIKLFAKRKLSLAVDMKRENVALRKGWFG